MTKLKFLIVFCLLTMGITQTFAQTYKVDGIESFNRNGIKAIKNGAEITGYILFYKTDKADSKNNNYAFELLDEKLNKVNRVKVTLPKQSSLIQSAYNGETLGLMFYDSKEGSYIFKAYDKTLKLAGSATAKDLNKYEKAVMERMEAEEAASYYGIQAVPGKGFVRAGYGEDKDQYSVTMYDTNFKKKWRYQTPDGSKGMETFILSDISDKYVSGLTMRRKGMMSTKFEYYLTVFDIETGKKMVDASVESTKENLSISATNLLDNDEILVQGEYYDLDDKAGVNKSNGLYLKKYDIKTAKSISETKFSWASDIKKLFDAKGKESIEDNYVNYPMDFIKATNGHYYIVYEQFKKAADGVGIAVIALGGQASAVKVKIGNIWVFEIDANYKPVGIKYYEKDASSVGLPAGSGMYGSGLLGMFAKGIGGFDYQFTQQSLDKSTFNVSYLNYDRESGEKTKTIVGNIFLAKDGSLNYDKVDITAAKKTNRAIYPASGNSVMLAVYNIKGESLELKLVKLNY